jgi:hypothetical protein
VVAGAIAAGTTYLEASALLKLFAAVLLAELAWGTLLRMSAKGRNESDVGLGTLYLPYATSAAPVGRLSNALTERRADGSVRSGWHDLVLGLVLTIALSLVLGGVAVLLSLLAVGASLAAWLLCHRKVAAALPLAMLGVGLPWLLGAGLDSRSLTELLRVDSGVILFAGVFTVLQWGALCVGTRQPAALVLIWLGQALAVVAAIGLGLPWLTIMLAALLLVPSIRVASHGRSVGRPPMLLASCVSWWWTAMMLAAIALRLSGAPAG